MNESRKNILKTNIFQKVQQAIRIGVFPGAAVGLVQGRPGQRLRLVETYGYTSWDENKEVSSETYYDLASLTKPFSTVLSLLCLLKEKNISLSLRLNDVFPERGLSSDIGLITVQDLLSHSAGLAAHKPYFISLLKQNKNKRKEMLFDLLAAENQVYKRGSRSVYSDLGFMFLGLLIEKLSRIPISSFFKEMLTDPLDLGDTIFFQNRAVKKEERDRYAPGEECPVRGRMVHAEVSDENAWAIGGAAGHAGLFGTIEGVLAMVEHLMDQWQGREEHPNYRSTDLQYFLKKQAIANSTWALGFDTPTPGGSSGGRYLSPTSVGHLGFTGTSFWIDPEKELAMVLLSNRVHLSRDNNLIKEFRPQFHEMLIESLGLV